VAPRLASKALHGGETGLLAGVRGRAGCRPFPQGRVLSVHARELLLARGELLALEQAPNQELEVPRQATLQASAGRRATARARVPTSPERVEIVGSRLGGTINLTYYSAEEKSALMDALREIVPR
jgi:hypothetical protein